MITPVVLSGGSGTRLWPHSRKLHPKQLLPLLNQTSHLQDTINRLENIGKIPLELIEVQTGSYLGEDDIVRFDDVYGRKGK
jgi:mannose-1-phosphate guanylyltransferase